MSPALRDLLAAIRNKDEQLAPLRDKVTAAADSLRANYTELKVGERALYDMRRKAHTLFGDEAFPTVFGLPDLEAALHGYDR